MLLSLLYIGTLAFQGFLVMDKKIKIGLKYKSEVTLNRCLCNEKELAVLSKRDTEILKNINVSLTASYRNLSR